MTRLQVYTERETAVATVVFSRYTHGHQALSCEFSFFCTYYGKSAKQSNRIKAKCYAKFCSMYLGQIITFYIICDFNSIYQCSIHLFYMRSVMIHACTQLCKDNIMGSPWQNLSASVFSFYKDTPSSTDLN